MGRRPTNGDEKRPGLHWWRRAEDARFLRARKRHPESGSFPQIARKGFAWKEHGICRRAIAKFPRNMGKIGDTETIDVLVRGACLSCAGPSTHSFP